MTENSPINLNAQAFMFAAAGCFSMVKTLQIWERKRQAKAKAIAPLRKLFPSEQQDEVVQQIDALRSEQRDHRNELIAIRAHLERISRHLECTKKGNQAK